MITIDQVIPEEFVSEFGRHRHERRFRKASALAFLILLCQLDRDFGGNASAGSTVTGLTINAPAVDELVAYSAPRRTH
ncbi:hypothetical protein [Ilumatobacter sp.]|jgi:hypothetical protein|uniref:hypothetical protein n=1 Tax=Ilumatobacter sp. TaxID=1967498 RepID=UPI00375313DB|nr:hypothetical protein [Ilumatobacter sp.]